MCTLRRLVTHFRCSAHAHTLKREYDWLPVAPATVMAAALLAIFKLRN